jgi:hypothetical protein
MTDHGTERTPPSTSHLPPAPREAVHATDVWVSLSIAVVLALIAATIALWPTEQNAKTAPQAAVALQSTKAPVSADPQEARPAAQNAPQNLPTRFTNPFDASEVFEFPPGTTGDAARASVAETLLQRGRERQAQIGGATHDRGHGRPLPPLQSPALASESIFRKPT